MPLKIDNVNEIIDIKNMEILIRRYRPSFLFFFSGDAHRNAAAQIAGRGACLGQMARRPLGQGALRNNHITQDTP